MEAFVLFARVGGADGDVHGEMERRWILSRWTVADSRRSSW